MDEGLQTYMDKRWTKAAATPSILPPSQIAPRPAAIPAGCAPRPGGMPVLEPEVAGSRASDMVRPSWELIRARKTPSAALAGCERRLSPTRRSPAKKPARNRSSARDVTTTLSSTASGRRVPTKGSNQSTVPSGSSSAKPTTDAGLLVTMPPATATAPERRAARRTGASTEIARAASSGAGRVAPGARGSLEGIQGQGARPAGSALGRKTGHELVPRGCFQDLRSDGDVLGKYAGDVQVSSRSLRHICHAGRRRSEVSAFAKGELPLQRTLCTDEGHVSVSDLLGRRSARIWRRSLPAVAAACSEISVREQGDCIRVRQIRERPHFAPGRVDAEYASIGRGGQDRRIAVAPDRCHRRGHAGEHLHERRASIRVDGATGSTSSPLRAPPPPLSSIRSSRIRER